jgi:hypothetical protein
MAPEGPVAPVWHLELGGGAEPEILLGGEFNENNVRFSPDGNWISYESNATGRVEVYVQSFPAPSGKWQVSLEGGEEALWNSNGKELFYWEDDQLMAVDVELAPTFSSGEPKPLFEMPTRASDTVNTVSYDVAPGGDRFVIIKVGEQSAWVTELIVVENWFEELKRLAPPAETP